MAPSGVASRYAPCTLFSALCDLAQNDNHAGFVFHIHGQFDGLKASSFGAFLILKMQFYHRGKFLNLCFDLLYLLNLAGNLPTDCVSAAGRANFAHQPEAYPRRAS